MPQAITQIAGSNASGLDEGIDATLVNGVTAAQTIANAGSAAQPTNPFFSFPSRKDGGARVLNLSGRGAGAVPTTLTVTLYGSDDGGATWKAVGAAIPLIATGVATDAQVQNLVAGRVYQLLVTTLTLGTATSVSVDGALS